MKNINVAELLVETLVAAGVNKIYGLAGDSLNGITDSIRQRNDLSWGTILVTAAKLKIGLRLQDIEMTINIWKIETSEDWSRFLPSGQSTGA